MRGAAFHCRDTGPDMTYRRSVGPDTAAEGRSYGCPDREARRSPTAFQDLGLGFRDSGLGFRALGFGIRVSGIGFRALIFGFQTLIEGEKRDATWAVVSEPETLLQVVRRDIGHPTVGTEGLLP